MVLEEMARQVEHKKALLEMITLSQRPHSDLYQEFIGKMFVQIARDAWQLLYSDSTKTETK